MEKVSNAEVMEAVKTLAAQVRRIAEQLEKANDRKRYHKEYYQRRKKEKVQKEEAASTKLQVPEDRSVFRASSKVQLPVAKWLRKLVQFHDAKRPVENFLTWLTWSWNRDTFSIQPITKSGGYHNVVIGLSGKKPIRNKHTDGDMFPKLRQRFTSVGQIDTFSNCKWWDFGFCVLGRVFEDAKDEGVFDRLSPRYQKMIRVMVGSTGECPAGDINFDPLNTNIDEMNKTIKRVRNSIECGVAACKRGLYMPEEPFTSYFQ